MLQQQEAEYRQEMRKTEAFSCYHPLVNFIYFAFVLIFSMWFTHPVCLGLTLAAALAYSIYLKGRKAIRFSLYTMLPLLIMTVLLNPLFTHEGLTILAYFPNDMPLTLESVCFGAAAGVMLVTVLCWFTCFNYVITTDKLIYLFGRIVPALSLILSMTLRVIPRFRQQLKVIVSAQRLMGKDLRRGSLIRRIRTAGTIISILVTWALENAIETADSMKNRGYGLPNRSSFSVYRFRKRDGWTIVFLSLCATGIVWGTISGHLAWQYYPVMQGTLFEMQSVVLYVVYLALCLMPLVIDLLEDHKWKSLRSKI